MQFPQQQQYQQQPRSAASSSSSAHQQFNSSHHASPFVVVGKGGKLTPPPQQLLPGGIAGGFSELPTQQLQQQQQPPLFSASAPSASGGQQLQPLVIIQQPQPQLFSGPPRPQQQQSLQQATVSAAAQLAGMQLQQQQQQAQRSTHHGGANATYQQHTGTGSRNMEPTQRRVPTTTTMVMPDHHHHQHQRFTSPQPQLGFGGGGGGGPQQQQQVSAFPSVGIPGGAHTHHHHQPHLLQSQFSSNTYVSLSAAPSSTSASGSRLVSGSDGEGYSSAAGGGRRSYIPKKGGDHGDHRGGGVTTGDERSGGDTSEGGGGTTSSGKLGGREDDVHRVQQREKQVNFGRVTEGYRNYRLSVPQFERQQGNPMHPTTPDVHTRCSKRTWDNVVGAWRRTLHQWDTILPPPISTQSTSTSGGELTAPADPTTTCHVPGMPTLAELGLAARVPLADYLRSTEAELKEAERIVGFSLSSKSETADGNKKGSGSDDETKTKPSSATCSATTTARGAVTAPTAAVYPSSHDDESSVGGNTSTTTAASTIADRRAAALSKVKQARKRPGSGQSLQGSPGSTAGAAPAATAFGGLPVLGVASGPEVGVVGVPMAPGAEALPPRQHGDIAPQRSQGGAPLGIVGLNLGQFDGAPTASGGATTTDLTEEQQPNKAPVQPLSHDFLAELDTQRQFYMHSPGIQKEKENGGGGGRPSSASARELPPMLKNMSREDLLADMEPARDAGGHSGPSHTAQQQHPSAHNNNPSTPQKDRVRLTVDVRDPTDRTTLLRTVALRIANPHDAAHVVKRIESQFDTGKLFYVAPPIAVQQQQQPSTQAQQQANVNEPSSRRVSSSSTSPPLSLSSSLQEPSASAASTNRAVSGSPGGDGRRGSGDGAHCSSLVPMRTVEDVQAFINLAPAYPRLVYFGHTSSGTATVAVPSSGASPIGSTMFGADEEDEIRRELQMTPYYDPTAYENLTFNPHDSMTSPYYLQTAVLASSTTPGGVVAGGSGGKGKVTPNFMNSNSTTAAMGGGSGGQQRSCSTPQWARDGGTPSSALLQQHK